MELKFLLSLKEQSKNLSHEHASEFVNRRWWQLYKTTKKNTTHSKTTYFLENIFHKKYSMCFCLDFTLHDAML